MKNQWHVAATASLAQELDEIREDFLVDAFPAQQILHRVPQFVCGSLARQAFPLGCKIDQDPEPLQAEACHQIGGLFVW